MKELMPLMHQGAENKETQRDNLLDSAILYYDHRDEENKELFVSRLKAEMKNSLYPPYGLTNISEYLASGRIFDLSILIIGANFEVHNPAGAQKDNFDGDELPIDNDCVEIRVIDEEKLLEKDDNWRGLVNGIKEEAQQFRLPQGGFFRGDLVVEKDILSIRMDPGSHKEFLGVRISSNPDTPHTLFYRHTPSPYERDSSYSGRREYIDKLIGFCVHTDRGISTIETRTSLPALEDKFRDYFRLCHSVKNLDIVLDKKNVDFAVSLFRAGCVNIQTVLLLANKCTQFSSEDEFRSFLDQRHEINDKEKELLGQYYADQIALRKDKAQLKEQLVFLRKAKDLNFEIISDLVKLDNRAREILCVVEPNPKLADQFISEYSQISEKFTQMANFCIHFVRDNNGSLFGVDLRPFLQKMRSLVEPLEMIARFGYGSADVLRYENGNVDVSEHGKKFLPEIARAAYEQFQKLLIDKGGVIDSWDTVDSMEEGVRFLHSEIIRLSAVRGVRSNMADLITRPDLYRGERNDLYPLRFVDVTSEGSSHSDLGKILIDNTLKKIGQAYKLVVNDRRTSDGYFPVMVLADDYFELSLPTGKHYIEISGQEYQKEPVEYSIALRYNESGYQYSTNRQNFARKILEDAGFTLKQDDQSARALSASITVRDKDKWNRLSQRVINLAFAVQDLDLNNIQEDVPELFNQGVISQFDAMREVKKTFSTHRFWGVEEDASYAMSTILKIGCESEQVLLARLLVEKMLRFDKDFVPYLKVLSEEERDELLHALFLLVDQLVTVDKKMVTKVRRVIKQAEVWMDAQQQVVTE